MNDFKFFIVASLVFFLPALALAQAGAEGKKRSLPPDDPSPSLLTLHLKDASVPQAIEQIVKQSGLAIDASRFTTGSRSVTLDVEDKPFWAVLLDVCEQANGVLTARRGGELALVPREGGSYSSSLEGVRQASGAFLLVAQQMDHVVDFTRHPDRQAEFSILYTLLPEPRLFVIAVSGPSIPEEAVDEKGNSLLPPPLAADVPDTYRPSTRYYPYVQSAIHLRIPPGAGRRIARLKGNVSLLLRTKSRLIEIADPTKAAEKQFQVPGAEGVIYPPQIRGNYCNVRVRFNRVGLSEEQWKQADRLLVATRIHLIDANGLEWSDGGGGASWSNSYRELHPSFSNHIYGEGPTPKTAGAPVKMIVEIPIEAKQINVPYEFKDLPRP